MQIAFGVFDRVFLQVHRKTAPTGGNRKCVFIFGIYYKMRYYEISVDLSKVIGSLLSRLLFPEAVFA